MRGPATTDRGFALLVVLWALVPLSLLFLALTATARSDLRSTADLRTAAQLEAEADGLMATAIFDLLGSGRAERDVAVVDLSGRVNPNTASAPLLQAVMIRLGVPDGPAAALAAAIVDWRSPGRTASLGGDKVTAYQRAGLNYGPPGAPFESIDELGQVLGMTPAVLAVLRPELTLFTDGDPQPQAASPAVRNALRDLGVASAGVASTGGAAGGGPAGGGPVRVLQITVTARNGAGDASMRRAVVRFGPSAQGRGWRVLTLDTCRGCT